MKQWYEYPELRDKDTFLSMMRKGMTLAEIAEVAGCSESAVRTAEKRHRLRKPVIIMSEELRRKLEL
jgi:DNA-directed RNA polymerase specialized sigma24 family protein